MKDLLIASTLLLITIYLADCQVAATPISLSARVSHRLMITGYSKVRMQNQVLTPRGPVVGSEKARELLLHPELATEPPEPDSIFVRPMKNVKKVNFPDEII